MCARAVTVAVAVAGEGVTHVVHCVPARGACMRTMHCLSTCRPPSPPTTTRGRRVTAPPHHRNDMRVTECTPPKPPVRRHRRVTPCGLSEASSTAEIMVCTSIPDCCGGHACPPTLNMMPALLLALPGRGVDDVTRAVPPPLHVTPSRSRQLHRWHPNRWLLQVSLASPHPRRQEQRHRSWNRLPAWASPQPPRGIR